MNNIAAPVPVSLESYKAIPGLWGIGVRRSYGVYGISIASEIPLALPEEASDRPDVELLAAPPAFFLDTVANAETKPSLSNWYRYCRMPDGTRYLRWDRLFEFLVKADGRRIWCGWLGATSLESLQVYLLGHALSYALVHQGREPLHSTVVVVDGAAIAFLGNSGFGKSSLAAAFLDAGYPILTDDLLLLNRRGDCYFGNPGPARIKLFPKVARRYLGQMISGEPMNDVTKKMVLPLGQHQSHERPARLRVIYVLTGPSAIVQKRVQLSRLSQREAFVEVIRNTFNYQVTGPDRLGRQFSESFELVSRVPVKRISYPRILSLLPDVRDTIVADLANETRKASG